jgi:AraC-like DNA-binding protein
MTFQFVEPSGFLKNYIKNYCFMESEFHEADIVERVIPTESIQIMFHYKNPFVVLDLNLNGIKQPRSIICGLSHSYSDVSTNGETGVVFISFYTIGASYFFDFSLSEIENQSIDLMDVYKPEIEKVEEMLYLKNTIQERVQVIEQFLIQRFTPIVLEDHLFLEKGIDLIKKSGGQTNAKAISQQLNATTKTVERKFSQYLGKSTKQLIKLIRFQEVLHQFGGSPKISLTDCAYKNGYFDQSHFIHEFKSYTGFTPKEFQKRYPQYNSDGEKC